MPRPKLRYLAVPDFRAKGVADARVAPMSIAVLRPESGEKLVHAPTLLLDTRGKEFPSARVSVEEALRTCVPPAAHPDPRAVAAAVSFMMEEELEDLATAYDGAVVDADLALLPVPPAPRPSHDDWKNFLLGALEREDGRREHRSSRADLEPVETPIAPRRNVLDDASRVAAPTGAQLATALKKFFSRSSRGSSPSPSRSDMFAPFTSRDRHEAARASAERETRAPFEKRARRALSAVHAADFTAPARRGRDEGGDEGHPLSRELTVVPVVFDALHDDVRRADRTEPVALAARMGFAPVTVPSVNVEWPRDILASVEAAVQGDTPEPIQFPTDDDDDDDETETGYDLRDLVRGMGADDVHVGPPRHAGSVVAALDEMAAREARAAAVAVEIKTTEEAVRRDESFQRAELERREHARAVLMGSGGGGDEGGGWGGLGGLGGGGDGGMGRGRGDAHDAMDVAFFVRPGGLHPRTRADDGAGTAPPPMTSPTAREANRLVALVEARPTPPSARDRGAGVIDLATTPPARGGGNERREPRPPPPTGLDFEPAISRRVAREISVEVIDDDDAEILDAADRAATERMAAQLAAAAAKDTDMDFIDDIAYPQPSPPPPPFRGGGWDHGAGFRPRSRPSRNPSPPPPHHPHPHPHPHPHHHQRDSREDDFGRRGWEDDSRRVRAVDRDRDRADEFPRVLPSSPDLSLSLRDLHPDEPDVPMTEVRRVVSDWRATGWRRRVSPPPHARHRREPRRSPRRRASRRSTSFDLDDLDILDDSDGGGFFASRLRPAPRLRARPVTRSVSPPGRSRDGDDDRPPRRYLRGSTTAAATATMPGAAYPRSTVTPGRSARRDGTFLDSAAGFDEGRRGGAFLATHRASAVGWGTPEKLRGMSRTTREHEPARGLDMDRRAASARRGLDDLGFGVASRGLVGGRRERERDAGLDEFMRMTAGYRYGA